jgi:hypothetical protein
VPGEETFRGVEFFTALLGAAAALALVSRRFGFPYTVALVLFGLAVAAFIPNTGFEITPELVLVVLLPALVFEAAYQTDIHRELKGDLLGPADNVRIMPNGDIVPPRGDEVLGNVYDKLDDRT